MSEELSTRLAERIRRGGPIPFASFMESALFDPEDGYYASGRVHVGEDRGDFTTAPHLTPVFARCLGRLAARLDDALGHPDPFVFFEGGPGEGRFAADLLDALRLREPALYQRLRYAPDERSAALSARQEEAWRSHREKIAAVAEFEGAEGLYFSNELLDAFPVHRLVRRGSELQEIYVDWDGGRFHEVFGPPSRPECAAELAADGIEVAEGCEVEVNLGVAGWLRGVGERLHRGWVVTVDYGDEAHRLYGPHRPQGTCAAYRGHRLSQDLLADPGSRDLTAHVNFSSLRRVGASLGWSPGALLPLREFLFALGLIEEVEAMEAEAASDVEALRSRHALAPLLLAMGEAHKALILARGVEAERSGLGAWEPGRGP